MDISADFITKAGKLDLRIREFNKNTDTQQVQDLERSCDEAAAPPAGKTSIVFTNMDIGDPLCRVRSYPVYCMLVAEAQIALEPARYRLVGIIRAGVKEVIRPVEKTCENTINGPFISSSNRYGGAYVTAMYISGLRVCCLYRRMGVAQRLVREIEAWGWKHGAEYAYLATENDNQASVSLFTHKLGYIKFRSPSILVQPVYGKLKLAHVTAATSFNTWQTRNNRILILKLSAVDAERLYRSVLGNTEFFPKDIDSVLRNPLNVGTWVACYMEDIRGYNPDKGEEGVEFDEGLNDLKAIDGGLNGLLKLMEEGRIAWAMLSLWRYEKLIRFQVRGASAFLKRWAALTRLASKLMPWVVLPCLPNVFDKVFGVQLMYGLHACAPRYQSQADPACISSNRHISTRECAINMNDKHGVQALMESLCWHAHNLALKAGCKAVAAETGSCDPLKAHIPHWPLLSEHDLWCVKRLSSCTLVMEHQNQQEDWCKCPPSLSLFLDPRDF